MNQTGPDIHIVTAADDNFSMPLGVTLYSILRNVNERARLHFYILDGGILPKNRHRLEKIFRLRDDYRRHRVQWIQPDLSQIRDLPRHSWMSEATYLRLLIPQILPQELEKVIYLDCDLVLETDIQSLWEEPLDGQVIGAVRDVLIQRLSHSTGVKNYESYGGTADSPYFNSGVMLIDIPAWRREKISEKSIDYLAENKETFTLHEQEALNAALIGGWAELDPRWNQQASIFWSFVLPETDYTLKIRAMYADLAHKPWIIHFISKSKPWDYKCMHPSIGRFMFYLKKSRWYSGPGWLLWWNRIRFRRFLWLFRDLKKTLNQVNVRGQVAALHE